MVKFHVAILHFECYHLEIPINSADYTMMEMFFNYVIG
jgi:hypothetical protein